MRGMFRRMMALACLVGTLGVALAQGQNEGKGPPVKPAAPAVGEEVKLLAARLGTLAKELEALKGLQPRLEAAEKTARDAQALRPRLEALAKQLDLLKGVPGRLDKVEDSLKTLQPARCRRSRRR